MNEELVSTTNKDLEIGTIKIDDINKVGDFLFIRLNNGQKILTNGKELYDVSEYSHLTDLIHMGDRFCAIFTKGLAICVVELETMEVLFEDEEAYHVSKQDERTLHIIKKVNCGNNTIYDIENKKYLLISDGYEFENSLGNNLYVFRENNKADTNFYQYKRCVINADGKVLMKDIEGWIYLSEGHIIIIKKDEMCIVGVNDETTLDMKMIKQNDDIIAKPAYYDGNILLMFRGVIRIYTPALELMKEIQIDELMEVIDYEIVSNTLKLCLSYTVNCKQINKHLFVNLDKGKFISHIRIECYPYWIPTTYVGKDTIDTGITSYHFYNKDLTSMISVKANSYGVVDGDKECMFVIRTLENDSERKQLLNAENGRIKDIDYDFIKFPVNHKDGYGVNFTTKQIEFFDEDLAIIIPSFDYEGCELRIDNFGYFIVNNYICIINHFVDGYGIARDRVIIRNATGDVILDSIEHRCFPLGNFMQIVHNGESEFLNTLTGEISQLSLSANVDKTGKIDLKAINNILMIGSEQLPLLPSDHEKPKVKRLMPLD